MKKRGKLILTICLCLILLIIPLSASAVVNSQDVPYGYVEIRPITMGSGSASGVLVVKENEFVTITATETTKDIPFTCWVYNGTPVSYNKEFTFSAKVSVVLVAVFNDGRGSFAPGVINPSVSPKPIDPITTPAPTPVPTVKPVVTPVPSGAPVVTPNPNVTPVPSGAPVVTPNPVVTPVPSGAPVVTPNPSGGIIGIITPVPSNTPIIPPSDGGSKVFEIFLGILIFAIILLVVAAVVFFIIRKRMLDETPEQREQRYKEKEEKVLNMRLKRRESELKRNVSQLMKDDEKRQLISEDEKLKTQKSKNQLAKEARENAHREYLEKENARILALIKKTEDELKARELAELALIADENAKNQALKDDLENKLRDCGKERFNKFEELLVQINKNKEITFNTKVQKLKEEELRHQKAVEEINREEKEALDKINKSEREVLEEKRIEQENCQEKHKKEQSLFDAAVAAVILARANRDKAAVEKRSIEHSLIEKEKFLLNESKVAKEKALKEVADREAREYAALLAEIDNARKKRNANAAEKRENFINLQIARIALEEAQSSASVVYNVSKSRVGVYGAFKERLANLSDDEFDATVKRIEMLIKTFDEDELNNEFVEELAMAAEMFGYTPSIKVVNEVTMGIESGKTNKSKAIEGQKKVETDVKAPSESSLKAEKVLFDKDEQSKNAVEEKTAGNTKKVAEEKTETLKKENAKVVDEKNSKVAPAEKVEEKTEEKVEEKA